jgi:hypothetical protein
MTATILSFPRNEGNGAREALTEIGKHCPFHIPSDIATDWAEDIMMELWISGFKIVPLDGTEEN